MSLGISWKVHLELWIFDLIPKITLMLDKNFRWLWNLREYPTYILILTTILFLGDPRNEMKSNNTKNAYNIYPDVRILNL